MVHIVRKAFTTINEEETISSKFLVILKLLDFLELPRDCGEMFPRYYIEGDATRRLFNHTRIIRMCYTGLYFI